MLRDHVLLPFTGNGRQPALDGLRGIAVIAVIAGHSAPDLIPGGTIGVDLFFVLSGLLITSILLDGLHRHSRTLSGTLGFWAGRARRLFPPLALVVGTTSVLAGRYGPPELWQRWRDDLWSGLTYTANYRFIATDTDYDVVTQGQSPLVHLWSLAVEEQFYLLWPLLLLIPPIRRNLPRWATLGALGATIIGSALVLVGAEPTRILFGTDTRATQLLIGAALGGLLWQHQRRSASAHALADVTPYGTPQDTPGGPRHTIDTDALPRPLAALARHPGLLATASALTLTAAALTPLPDTSAAAWTRILVVTLAGAGLLLVVTTTPDHLSARLLGTRPLTFLGVISYSIYLWHLPLLWLLSRTSSPDTWLSSNTATSQIGRTLLILALSSALALLSWLLIEGPLRAVPIQTQPPTLTRPLIALGAGSALLVGTAVVVAQQLAPTGVYAAMAIDAQRYPCPDGSPVCQVRDTARPDEWGCDEWPCVLYQPEGTPAATVLLTGDSVGRSLTPGLLTYAVSRRWAVVADTQGCSLVASPKFGYGGGDNPDNYDQPDCRDNDVMNWEQTLADYDIDVAVTMTSTMRAGVLRNGTPVYADEPDYPQAYAEAVEPALTALDNAGVPLVLVLMPHQTTAANCDTGRDYTPDTCILGGSYPPYEKPILEQIVAPRAGVTVDLTPVLCTSDPCGPGEPLVLRHDGSHVSFTGTTLTAPYIADAIEAALRTRTSADQ